MVLPTEAMLDNDIYDDNGDPLPKAEELIRILSQANSGRTSGGLNLFPQEFKLRRPEKKTNNSSLLPQAQIL